MLTKYNEATINRPEGDRIIDAPFVFIDLERYGQQLKEEDTWTKNDRNSITVYKTDGFTMVLSRLRYGAMIKDNLVGTHITIQVLGGVIDFTVETGTIQLIEQQIITVHPGIMHTIEAREESLVLITSKVLC